MIRRGREDVEEIGLRIKSMRYFGAKLRFGDKEKDLVSMLSLFLLWWFSQNFNEVVACLM